MMKAKEWLKANGHIAEVTKGRISFANHALIAEAYAAGTRFSDWEPKESTSKTTGEKVITNSVKVGGGSEIENYKEPFYRYPGNMNDYVVTDEEGKKRSLKEACNGCGYSLVGHMCSDPRIVRLDASGSTRVTVAMANGRGVPNGGA